MHEWKLYSNSKQPTHGYGSNSALKKEGNSGHSEAYVLFFGLEAGSDEGL